ncbi:MAG: UPF0182 family protein, partial [Gammaproteobacteria bacterium]
IFFLDFWIASSFLGREGQYPRSPESIRIQDLFRSGSMKVYTPVSLVLAVIVALPLYRGWEAALMFFFGSSVGVNDPVYGNDIGFYLFDYPVFELIQKELLTASVLLLGCMALLYWAQYRFIDQRVKGVPFGAKLHLSVLWGFVTLFVVWGLLLDRFNLLYVDTHEPAYFGPGFVDLLYQLPLIWLSIVAFLSIALSVLFLAFYPSRIPRSCLLISCVIFVGMIGLRHAGFISNLIERYVVTPNPVSAEKAFMEYNIEATLNAYQLDGVQTIERDVTVTPEADLAYWVNAEHLQNIPIWDRELLSEVYQQLQGIRPYYGFPTVDEDRYQIGGQFVQVNIAAREVNVDKLPAEARNWENLYLRYVHGYGVVVSPAAQSGRSTMGWYVRDLNLHSDVGMKVVNPDIYYGQEDLKRAIVPNALKVVGMSGSDPDTGPNNRGAGGVPIPSLFRKALFAIYFADKNIFFSTNIDTESRILFRRNIAERIHRLAPYLALDSDPYVVMTSFGLFWIQDAYTLSDRYPVSKHSRFQFRARNSFNETENFNYIRNSIKVVVNAYNGETHFYVSDPGDPIIQAYRRAYPGFFKDMSELSGELQSHLRYPRDFFYLQMKMYAKYHQTEPEMFFQQAETWTFAKSETGEVLPYYLTITFEDCPDTGKFVLINPMTPIGRDNLSGLAVAGSFSPSKCTSGYSQNIALFKFKKDIQVEGPSQVSALIAQDPKIAQQITLWDQRGVKVVHGRMIILPAGKSLLYIEPIYMISKKKTNIPELIRIIIATRGVVVMEESLEQGFKALEAKLRQNRDSNPERATN